VRRIAMRTISIREFVLEEFNRMLAAEGRDVELVAERPKPRLVAEVVELREERGDDHNS
jgi:hypothetical protein